MGSSGPGGIQFFHFVSFVLSSNYKRCIHKDLFLQSQHTSNSSINMRQRCIRFFLDNLPISESSAALKINVERIQATESLCFISRGISTLNLHSGVIPQFSSIGKYFLEIFQFSSSTWWLFKVQRIISDPDQERHGKDELLVRRRPVQGSPACSLLASQSHNPTTPRLRHNCLSTHSWKKSHI